MLNFSKDSLEDIFNLIECRKGKVVFYSKDWNGVLELSEMHYFLHLSLFPVYAVLSGFHIISLYEMESYTICILAKNKLGDDL